MQAGDRQVLVEEVAYYVKKDRVSKTFIRILTKQNDSRFFVGKRKPNTLADLSAALDLIASSGKVVRIRKRFDGATDAVKVAVHGWGAVVEGFLEGRESLRGRCYPSGESWPKSLPGVGKKGLKVGGILLGPGATLEGILRQGFGEYSALSGSFTVRLSGPSVTFGKKKLKILHLGYTFRSPETPLMQAVIEASKDNPPSDLNACYEFLEGLNKDHDGLRAATRAIETRTTPGKQEVLFSLYPKDRHRLRCLLETRKDSNGKRIPTRLEIAYPGDWTINLPLADIEKDANSGRWRQMGGWRFDRDSKQWKRGGRWVYESLNKSIVEHRKKIGALPIIVDTLIKDLASRKRDTRLLAVLILGKGGSSVSRSAIPTLRKIAEQDSDPYVRKAAADAIKKIMRKSPSGATSRPK
jgi:hypothetical protein